MKYLYPNGKPKALTFSYDDGQKWDVRLAELFRSHGLKGTFNLNSSHLGDDDNGLFVNKNKLAEIYKDHEIAVHGVEHLNPMNLTDQELVIEIYQDRVNFEKLLGHPVQGMAYAYGAYNEHIIEVIKSLGINYARTVGENHYFDVPKNFLAWDGTCHHNNDLMKHGEEFLNCPDWKELPLMYVWGHSYEFGYSDDWSIIENFVELVSGKDDIWYATNGEICDYITAIRRLEHSADGSMVKNPTDQTIWYKSSSGNIETIKPSEIKTVVL